jgi:hypothetical protein
VALKQLSLITVEEPTQPDGVDLRCCSVEDLFEEVQGARIVFCDPPWTYSNSGDKTRSAASHYPCLKMRDIVRHVRQSYDSAAEDAYLVIWATFPLLGEWMAASTEEAIRWRYVTGGAWAKIGAPGAGFHWRGNAEPILIYRKGKPKPCTTKILRSTHVTEQHRGIGQRTAEALAHSEKPISYQTNMIEVWSNPGDLIFDVYAGLCSVGRAVRRAGGGRRYVGAELDPERYRQAVDRLALDRSTQPQGVQLTAEERIEEVIREARSHVYRQQYHGRHEQDRADAVAWMLKHTDQTQEGE